MSTDSIKSGSGDIKKLVVFAAKPFSKDAIPYIKRLANRNIQTEIIVLSSPKLSKDDFKDLVESSGGANLLLLSRDNLENVTRQADTLLRTGEFMLTLLFFVGSRYLIFFVVDSHANVEFLQSFVVINLYSTVLQLIYYVSMYDEYFHYSLH